MFFPIATLLIVSAAEILKRGGFSAGFGTSREEKYPVDSEMNSFA